MKARRRIWCGCVYLDVFDLNEEDLKILTNHFFSAVGLELADRDDDDTRIEIAIYDEISGHRPR